MRTIKDYFELVASNKDKIAKMKAEEGKLADEIANEFDRDARTIIGNEEDSRFYTRVENTSICLFYNKKLNIMGKRTWARISVSKWYNPVADLYTYDIDVGEYNSEDYAIPASRLRNLDHSEFLRLLKEIVEVGITEDVMGDEDE